MTERNITTMQISRDFWKFIQDHQRLGESKEDTLKRLIKEDKKDE